ncbi:type II secretion system protein [Candidatus Wolfebacteria bacterium]|nr:type II secretion system protein [Candidatus Wolfebacteria bacterium]
MKKGFTLIELVIVIGILAILAAVVVLVLNPAQLLAQARDSQRLSDLGSIKSAIALYLATASSPTIGATASCTATDCTADCAFSSAVVSSSTLVTGAGWVDVDLTGTTGGAALSALPLDPTNSGSYYYAYDGEDTDKTFELNCRLESERYRGMMISDGGDDNVCSTYTEATCFYEVGTKPGLDF